MKILICQGYFSLQCRELTNSPKNAILSYMSPDLNIEANSFRRVEASPKPESIEIAPHKGGVELNPEVFPQKEQQEQTSKRDSVSEGAYAHATGPVAQSDVRQVTVGTHAEVKQIEKVLEEHLEVLYAQLPDDKKKEFRVKGEETARSIDVLLHRTKVKLREIISLIVSWLSLIPGVNKFFIEQQAEIKANKLLAVYDRYKKNTL